MGFALLEFFDMNAEMKKTNNQDVSVDVIDGGS